MREFKNPFTHKGGKTEKCPGFVTSPGSTSFSVRR